MRLYYAGYDPNAHGFGWATCNANLRRSLGCRFQLVDDARDAEVAFVPLTNHDLDPVETLNTPIRLAYTFFEFPLGPRAATNAAGFDLIFCGSGWCQQRLFDIGVHNSKVLIQGVDYSLFRPRGRQRQADYRIFSGGKCEYRKGQDLAIEAFSRFRQQVAEAHLVCSWFNPWPQLIHFANPENLTQEQLYASVLRACGIPDSAFTVLPALDQASLAAAMANTDCGLFPNRCEGGTNLVLMEYLATGNPAVANLETGHGDLEGANIFSYPCGTDSNHWAEQSVEVIVGAMLAAYKYGRNDPDFPRWTWEAAADLVAAEAARIAAVKAP